MFVEREDFMRNRFTQISPPPEFNLLVPAVQTTFFFFQNLCQSEEHVCENERVATCLLPGLAQSQWKRVGGQFIYFLSCGKSRITELDLKGLTELGKMEWG
jgi:hypothetical protein